MPIKMRVLHTPGKKKFAKIAGIIKQKYELVQNSTDIIPPAYSCDKERIVILELAGKSDVDDSLRRFCRELNKQRTSNVALIIEGTPVYADNVKGLLREAGTNVVDEVLYIKGGIPFFASVKPEEEAAVLDWLEHKVLPQLQ